jgi:hypothetical protein
MPSTLACADISGENNSDFRTTLATKAGVAPRNPPLIPPPLAPPSPPVTTSDD